MFPSKDRSKPTSTVIDRHYLSTEKARLDSLAGLFLLARATIGFSVPRSMEELIFAKAGHL